MKPTILRALYLLIITFLTFLSPTSLSAHPISEESATNQFITIVNPVRISIYNPDPLASLNAEYFELQKRRLPSSWLLTYDILSLPDLNNFAALTDQTQDFGIWLEVTPEFTKAAGVTYVQSDSWHRAKSIFLSGYSQTDRLKLIDTVFIKYYQLFGAYPTSVGAWWVDSFSLDYMQQKYHVTANLGVADQFSTDGYHVWGQYWAAPFYPSKLHTALPASSIDQKIDLVNLQWAPRDPINGYGRDRASLFSSQDFYTIGKDEEYLGQLINTYGLQRSNNFGQFTIGLEGDMSSESYSGQYAKILDLIQAVSNKSNYQITNMTQFANWYRQTYPDISDPYFTLTRDLLGGEESAIWYQSTHYRINFVYSRSKRALTMRDFRIYPSNFPEPYFTSPNSELDLYINTPSVLDSASNEVEEWTIENVDLVTSATDHTLSLDLGQNRSIILSPEYIETKNIKHPEIIAKSPLLSISSNQNIITPIQKWLYPLRGDTFSDLTTESTYTLKTKKVQFILIAFVIFCVITTILISRTRKPIIIKILFPLFLIFVGFLTFQIWASRHQMKYSISNDELTSLQKLSTLPTGKVVVYDKFCLQCQWSTEYKPAVYANKRDYVSRLSGKPIIYNKSVFDSPTRDEAKAALKKLNAKYIYTVKYDNYLEAPPFSPGDLGITKIFENASAQIWQIKD